MRSACRKSFLRPGNTRGRGAEFECGGAALRPRRSEQANEWQRGSEAIGNGKKNKKKMSAECQSKKGQRCLDYWAI
ncbi:hypothetical protein Y1Q_0006670 [Alligator mississippiensis]|uniref:Uncharacterized protein n=1 Tax=Alligator mississippiensis TaxID=8496 RepID=A0A151NTT6_ALLMI|nr:hypothetical protein Y1Q_0006670 [Alligator mississippiensis]